MTTGEGGMFVTNDPSLYETALSLNNHGRVRGKQFWAQMFGINLKYQIFKLQLVAHNYPELMNWLGERKKF